MTPDTDTAVLLTHPHPKYDSGATRTQVELLQRADLDLYALTPHGHGLEPHGDEEAYAGIIPDRDGEGTPYDETVQQLDAAYDEVIHGGGLDNGCLPRTMDAFDAEEVIADAAFGVWSFNQSQGYRLADEPRKREDLREAYSPYEDVSFSTLDDHIDLDTAQDALLEEYREEGEHESALRVCRDLDDTEGWDREFDALTRAVEEGEHDPWPLTGEEYLRNVSTRLRPS